MSYAAGRRRRVQWALPHLAAIHFRGPAMNPIKIVAILLLLACATGARLVRFTRVALG